MANFTTQALVNDQVFVTGTDNQGVVNSIVLDGTQWAEVNSHKEFDQATAAFDAAVEAFFKPLTEAAEKAEKALERPTDSLGYVVLHEGVEGQPAKAEQLIKLNKDSMVLRLIDQQDFNRLIWVDGQLEILAVAVTVAATTTVTGEDESEVSDS